MPLYYTHFVTMHTVVSRRKMIHLSKVFSPAFFPLYVPTLFVRFSKRKKSEFPPLKKIKKLNFCSNGFFSVFYSLSRVLSPFKKNYKIDFSLEQRHEYMIRESKKKKILKGNKNNGRNKAKFFPKKNPLH